MNATKHNLSGRRLVVLNNENDEAFQELFQAFIEKFQPQDPIEHECVLQAAVARWRLRRIWQLETAIFDAEMDKQAPQLAQEFVSFDEGTRQARAFTALAGNGNSLALLNRYERSISREYQRALKDLDRARAERQYRAQMEANNEPATPGCGAGPRPAAASQAAPQPEIVKTQNEPRTALDAGRPQPPNVPEIAPDTQNPPLPEAA
jgi:hypothetical protein